MVLLDEREELPDLIRLGLASDWLDVQPLGDPGVHEDVMASADPVQLEAAGLNEQLEVREGHVSHLPAPEASKEFLRFHAPGNIGRLNDTPWAETPRIS